MTTRSNYTRQNLETLLKMKCGFSNIKPFQLDHGFDLVCGKDVFLVIAPGAGKSTVICAPLLVAQDLGETGIAIAIVPTKILSEQLVGCLYHLCSVAFYLTVIHRFKGFPNLKIWSNSICDQSRYSPRGEQSRTRLAGSSNRSQRNCRSCDYSLVSSKRLLWPNHQEP